MAEYIKPGNTRDTTLSALKNKLKIKLKQKQQQKTLMSMLFPPSMISTSQTDYWIGFF